MQGREIYLAMLTQIPGIDRQLAERMVNRYGALENLVWNIYNKTDEVEVEGLSKEMVEKLKWFFESQKWEED